MPYLRARRAISLSRRLRWHSRVCVTSDRFPRASAKTASRVSYRRCILVFCIQCAVELLLDFEYLRTEPFRLRFWCMRKCTHRINVRHSPLNKVFQESCSVSCLAPSTRWTGKRHTPSLNVSRHGFHKLFCRCHERFSDTYRPYLLGLALVQRDRKQHWEVC